jgi:hypothetical protein
VGTRLAIEQGDLAEPVGRLDQGQQCLLAVTADRADPHHPLQHGIQAAGRIAAAEQALPRLQLQQARLAQQLVAQGTGQMAEPLAAFQQGAIEGGGFGHGFVA